MEVVKELSGLEKVLNRLIRRCMYCVYHVLEESKHMLKQCEEE